MIRAGRRYVADAGENAQRAHADYDELIAALNGQTPTHPPTKPRPFGAVCSAVGGAISHDGCITSFDVALQSPYALVGWRVSILAELTPLGLLRVGVPDEFASASAEGRLNSGLMRGRSANRSAPSVASSVVGVSTEIRPLFFPSFRKRCRCSRRAYRVRRRSARHSSICKAPD